MDKRLVFLSRYEGRCDDCAILVTSDPANGNSARHAAQRFHEYACIEMMRSPDDTLVFSRVVPTVGSVNLTVRRASKSEFKRILKECLSLEINKGHSDIFTYEEDVFVVGHVDIELH